MTKINKSTFLKTQQDKSLQIAISLSQPIFLGQFRRAVVVIPDSTAFHALSKQAVHILGDLFEILVILPHITDSINQDFAKRRARVGLLCALDEYLYCICEAWVTPWSRATERIDIVDSKLNIVSARRLNSPDFYSFFEDGVRTLLIGLGCGYIHLNRLSSNVTPINIHPGVLPFYPGLGNPEALVRKDFGCMGVSVHLMTARIDADPVLARKKIALLKRLDMPTAYLYAYIVGLKLLPGIIANGKKQELMAEGKNFYNSPCLWRMRFSLFLFTTLRQTIFRILKPRLPLVKCLQYLEISMCYMLSVLYFNSKFINLGKFFFPLNC